MNVTHDDVSGFFPQGSENSDIPHQSRYNLNKEKKRGTKDEI
ncbi:hypothetical protein [uncultured Faecalibaculum sp.]|nr:hypothetical protein [uncultured Faecalibaculum sp.]